MSYTHTHTHTRTHTLTHTHIGFPGSSEVKESAYNVGAAEDEGSVPGWVKLIHKTSQF